MIIPVSYTHLDVYKRQSFLFSVMKSVTKGLRFVAVEDEKQNSLTEFKAIPTCRFQIMF